MSMVESGGAHTQRAQSQGKLMGAGETKQERQSLMRAATIESCPSKTRLLVINPGTTSTKFGVYTRDGAEMARNLHHGDDELARFRGRPMMDRLEYRAELVEAALEEAGYSRSGKGAE